MLNYIFSLISILIFRDIVFLGLFLQQWHDYFISKVEHYGMFRSNL